MDGKIYFEDNENFFEALMTGIFFENFFWEPGIKIFFWKFSKKKGPGFFVAKNRQTNPEKSPQKKF